MVTSSRATDVLLIALLLSLLGCDNMDRQPKLKPLEPYSFFADGRSARKPVEGTIARGQLHENDRPPPLTRELLNRGHERYDIFCSVCHGGVGNGQGMVVKRGFPKPPSFHEDRLRRAPESHFVDVITNGYGVMYSYGDRIKPDDRWAIAAYIRALQRSQHARLSDAPAPERERLENQK